MNISRLLLQWLYGQTICKLKLASIWLVYCGSLYIRSIKKFMYAAFELAIATYKSCMDRL